MLIGKRNMSSWKMNRKGHVPTILLFVVALVLILAAWFTFFGIDDEIGKKAVEINIAVINLSFQEKYIDVVFERTVKMSIERADRSDFRNSFETEFREIVSNLREVSDSSSNLFDKVREKEYSLVSDGANYRLTIEEITVVSQVGKTELKRTFVFYLKLLTVNPHHNLLLILKLL